MKPNEARLEIQCHDELGHPTVTLYAEVDLDGRILLVTADGDWHAEVAPARRMGRGSTLAR
jgi:hypothetical protein